MVILFNKPYGVISQFSEHRTYASLKDYIPYKNVYPADKKDLKVNEDKGSALSALGLKPKIVH